MTLWVSVVLCYKDEGEWSIDGAQRLPEMRCRCSNIWLVILNNYNEMLNITFVFNMQPVSY